MLPPFVESVAKMLHKKPALFAAVWSQCRREVQQQSGSNPEVVEGTREFVLTALLFREKLGVDRPVYLPDIEQQGGPRKPEPKPPAWVPPMTDLYNGQGPRI